MGWFSCKLHQRCEVGDDVRRKSDRTDRQGAPEHSDPVSSQGDAQKLQNEIHPIRLGIWLCLFLEVFGSFSCKVAQIEPFWRWHPLTEMKGFIKQNIHLLRRLYCIDFFYHGLAQICTDLFSVLI